MQINIALNKDSVEQAKIIRSAWYPNTTARQTRDAFIFNDALDRFKGNPMDLLLPIIERDEGEETIQRMLTIKVDSNERLKTIASAINKSIAATYRAIIAYTIDNLNKKEIEETPTGSVGVGVSQLVIEKVALLEKQLDACNRTIKEIKDLIEEEIV